jgi:hypothetical protein
MLACLTMGSNPWTSIPLADYEGHMDAAKQLRALSDLFARALELCRPTSVAVLGIAGGNGLEHVDRATTTRIVGVDINAAYLDEVQRRFGADSRLELHCVDLSQQPLEIAPVALVHAALFFEHAGVGRALEHALSLMSPGGRLSVVLQLPDTAQAAVTPTPYASMQRLAGHFSFVDVTKFRGLLENQGLQLVTQEARTLSTGKTLWLGIFAGSRHT